MRADAPLTGTDVLGAGVVKNGWAKREGWRAGAFGVDLVVEGMGGGLSRSQCDDHAAQGKSFGDSVGASPDSAETL
jgi:hypothetical protein